MLFARYSIYRTNTIRMSNDRNSKPSVQHYHKNHNIQKKIGNSLDFWEWSCYIMSVPVKENITREHKDPGTRFILALVL